MKTPTTSGERPRPIRVLIAKPGLDGHDVGAKLVCRALMDAGMEVIYSGLKRSPEEIAEAALEEDVDVIGLSILSGAHVSLCRTVATQLASRSLADKLLIAGGNIPPQDHAHLEEVGVARVFPVGTPFGEITDFVREKVQR